MDNNYPPGTPSDFLRDEEPKLVEDFNNNMIDSRIRHWDTDWGAVPVDSIEDFVKYLIKEDFETLTDIVIQELEEAFVLKGDE